MQFYRKIHSPRSVDALVKDLKANHLVWIDDESFIVLKKLPKSVPFFSKFRKATTSIGFVQKLLHVYGISNKVVAAAAARFLCLKDGKAEEVRIGDHYSPAVDPLVPTAFVRPVFYKYYIKANPQRRLVFGRGCYLSKNQAIALASHPLPLNVGIECLFEDCGRAFVETLSQRTTHFGTLSSHGRCFDSLYYNYSSSKVITEVMRAVSQISLHTTSRILKSSQCLLPLSSTARRVEYKVCGQTGLHDIESLTIVPRAVTLVFDDVLPAHFHTLFLRASGNLQEMGVVYDPSHPPSVTQQSELLEAIAMNKNLRRLELGCRSLVEDFWYELCETIGSHGGLRSVVFWIIGRASDIFDQVEALEDCMETYDHLDITLNCKHCDLSMDSVEMVKIMDDFLDPIRFRNRVRALTRVSFHDRPALFGAALTSCAGGDFSKTSTLLTENADLLCYF